MRSARAWKILLLPLLVACLVACRGPTPGVLAGESAHFRLFVDPALGDVPSYEQGQNGIDTLEADWSDKASMLNTPDGKIDYYLLTTDDVTSACAFAESVGTDAGCTWPSTLEIDAAYLPHQHELMHAYMDLLAPGPAPLPMIAEGAAQSLGCSTGQGTPFDEDPAWQVVVTHTPEDSGDVYDEGGLLARYLIRTQGIDAWVRYYQQAPEVRDPAVFAANFQAFWGTTIDAAWTAMHVPPVGSVDMDQTICPCSLPGLGPESQPEPPFSPGHIYWSLPDPSGQALALQSFGGGWTIALEDCAGLAPNVVGQFGTPILTDLPATGRWFALTVAGATPGAYLADDCASTVPYVVSADLLSGSGQVELVAARTTSGPFTKYTQVQVPAPTQVMVGYGQEVCDTCNFDQGSCQPAPNTGATVPVQGTFYFRNNFSALEPDTPNPDVVQAGIEFAN